MGIRPGNNCCGNEAGLVQKFIGSAYDVVKNVADSLEEIKFIFDFMSKYDILLCVESIEELKQVNWKSSKFVRRYVRGNGATTYVDYIYVSDDKSGILPENAQATGSWVEVNTLLGAGGGNSIPWLYNKGSANGGEVDIHVEEDAIGVSEIFINGLRKHLGIGFTYEPVSRTIQLPSALAKGDQLVAKLIGYPALPNTPNISEFMFVNWVYNNGASIGGETKLKPPYTFQRVPAVFINGLRKLENHDYTVNYADYSINLITPLKVNDVVIVQLGGEADAFSIDGTIAREALRRSYAEAGFNLVKGSFEQGGTVTKESDVLLHMANGLVYCWEGTLPAGGKVIPQGSTPESSGGIGTGAWVEKSNSFLRSEVTPKLSFYGAKVGKDNRVAIQAAFDSLAGTGRMLDVDGDYEFTGELVCNEVTLVGSGTLSGGSLLGVLSNSDIPYEIINCWNNVVTKAERNDINYTGADIVVDPLFGDDNSLTKVKSLQRALDALATIVSTSPSRDCKIAFRSGRTEVPAQLVVPPILNGWGGKVDEIFNTSQMKFSDITINPDSTARYGIHLVTYPGEFPTICPPTKWFFTKKATSKYRGHDVVTNTTRVRFFKLFGADGIERQCAGSWNRDTYAVQRNQVPNIAISGTGQNIIHKLEMPFNLQEVLLNASAEELASIRVRVTHWFTSSWHVENIAVDGATLSFKGYTADPSYADGWAVIGADQYGAPFFVENLKSFITYSDEFASTPSQVVLPSDGLAFFTTVPLTYPALVDFSDTKNVTIGEGVSIKYVVGDPIQVAANTRGVKENPFSAIKLGNHGSVYSSNLYGVEGDAIKLCKVGGLVKNCNLKRIGGNAVAHVSGAHYSIIRNCVINEYALDQVGAFGITVTGKDIEISGNTITDGGFSAIRCDSSAFISDQSFGTVMSGGIFNNVCLGIGMRNGRLSERFPTGDTGMLTVNGRGPKTNYWIYGNVLGNCIGAGGSRALFLDDGVNGTRIHSNILFGAQDYSMDARQVSNNTYDNQVYNNILVGDVRQYSVNPDSQFVDNILFGSMDLSKEVSKFGNTDSITNQGMRCQQMADHINVNVSDDLTKHVITVFTRPFIRKLSYL